MLQGSNKAYKGTVVNQVLPSLHGGTLKFTLTVPLKVLLNNTMDGSGTPCR